MSYRILVVDDETGIRDSLRGVLEDEGFSVDLASTGEDCLQIIEKQAYHCILLDIWLPGMDGMAVLERIRATHPETAVVMISGHGTIQMAVKATRLGAADFIEKPLHIEKTLDAIRNAIKAHARMLEAASRENGVGRENGHQRDHLIIGDSVPMRALRQQIALAGPTNGRVLIYGETGTGKELVARALHHQSLRASSGSFVALNCAAIPEELIESELFGHTKGAFTGATGQRRGKFEQSDNGTLFLDEIGDMSLKTQAKVLRVLEEQSFEPVGGNSTISVDVRMIAATNKRLDEEIEKGNFRADLFYRLNVIPFQIPPLREHIEDIPILVEHFTKIYTEMYRSTPRQFTDGAIDKLLHYSWPGNVRELRATVERLVIMTQREWIEPDDLPFTQTDSPLLASFRFDSYREAQEAYEREFIQRKLAENNGNVTHTAEALNMDRSHLYRRIKTLGISIRG